MNTRQIQNFTITKVLIAINIAAFIYAVLFVSPGILMGAETTDSLLKSGAMVMTHFQPYQLFTSMFVHLSLMHILFNMVVLNVFGMMMANIGFNKLILPVYLITGFVGNILTTKLMPFSASAGASGAIMGIAGFIVLISFFSRYRFARAYSKECWSCVAATVLFGFFTNANNVAHIGGFMAGAVIAIAVGLISTATPRR